MKRKIPILVIIIFVFNSQLYSQCTNTISYGSANAPTTNIPINISSCNYQTEYSTISNIVVGRSYQITNSSGGYITVRSGTYNGPVVGSGNAPFTFTATVSGNHYIHYNTNASCGTATNCCTTTIICTSCLGLPPPSNDACSNATPLTVNPDLNCGTTTAGTIESATNSGINSNCSGTPNDDVWYTFVATNASHTIDLLNVTGSTTDLYHAVYAANPCTGSTTTLTCSDPN